MIWRYTWGGSDFSGVGAIDRRHFLVAGLGGVAAVGVGGAGLVQADVLPGRIRMDKALGRCGDAPEAPVEQANVRRERFRSAARGRDVAMTVVTPKGIPEKGLPVAVALHGFGGDDTALLGLRADRYLAHAVQQGVPPYALVGVDGGDTYWHRRRSGDDPERMILDEVLPRLRARGMRTDRIALTGWSMGGYGALLLAQRLGPGRVAAVAVSSPAIFPTHEAARGANEGAFDDADDFARNDVLAGLGRLRPVRAWVDCGHSDVFAEMTERVRGRMTPRPEGGMFDGCHDGAYWMRRNPERTAFIGRELR